MTADKVRLLMVQANPPHTQPLDTAVEQRKLDTALWGALNRAHFEVVTPLMGARIGDLPPALRRHRPHIVHFMGHGDGQGGLLLNAPNDRDLAILTAAALTELISAYQSGPEATIQLIVLAGCHTAPAAQLLAAHVPCTIGSTDDLNDHAVRDVFTPAFFAALGDGRSVANALASAQAELRAQGYAADAALLHLYTHPATDANTLKATTFLPPLSSVSLSSAQLTYLHSWFNQPWTTVSLADVQSERHDQAQLLDLYVPLPVKLELMIQTAAGRIVDWWVKTGVASEDGSPRQPSGKGTAPSRKGDGDKVSLEGAGKVRRWAELNVDEAGLQLIVDGVQRKLEQRKLDQRQAAGEKIEDGEESYYLEAHQAASVQPRFVLLGDPGSGKSSFLRHLTLCLAGELLHQAGDAETPANASRAALGDWGLGDFTPLYVEMRNLVRDAFPPLPAANQPLTRPTAQTLWDYVQRQPDWAPFTAELRALAGKGEAILLLDGLDEIPQADDPRRRDQVKAFMAALVRAHPKLRLIVGSRPHAYTAGEWALAGFGHTQLQPLRLERLQELAQRLFGVAQLGEPEREAAHFVQALEEHEHIDASFHANPLFFTLLAALWLANPQRQLPATQAELYRAAVDLLLDRWTRRRAADLSVADNLGVNAVELRQVLETLACTIHEQQKPGADTTHFQVETLLGILYRGNYRVYPQDVADYLTRHAGLLVAPAPGAFYFSHRSFQEHLAACELTCREPARRRPPVAPDRHFPAGLIHRIQEQPALWENVAHLAAAELMAQGREPELWALLHACCQPYLQHGATPEATALALAIARRHDLFDRDRHDWRYGMLEPLRQVALRVLTDVDHFPPEQRNIAGELLGRRPEHDTRPGVGRRSDGLPDLDWVKIPEMDAQSRRAFIYQEGERRTEPTFWMARYPVTYGQFQAFLDAADGFDNPVWWEGLVATEEHRAAPGEQRFPFWNHPRERVSWVDAIAFCRWLTAQAQATPALLPAELRGQNNWRITLPTEWQWEKAARGFAGRRYPWGEEYQSGHANLNETYQNAGTSYLGKTSAVGMYPQGASPFGLLDLSGNVWEWCLNEYAKPDRTQEGGDATRVVRGGSWLDDADLAAPSFRYDVSWYFRYYDYGLRLAVCCGSVPVA